ncbi:MAG: VanZ family protein [Deltaproteobacteria bacterium]|nr:VanZ family protein [Deltaproteobacteria bacterium]
MAIEKAMFRGRFKTCLYQWLPPIAYMALIFYISSQSLRGLPLPKNTDKIIHFIEFGILGILWFRALKTVGVNNKQIVFVAFAITFLYGISDEIHQYFVPERDASVFDAVADGLGGWMGIWLYKGVFNASGKHHNV